MPTLYELIDSAKAVAQDYYKLTGRPLGITGEVAEVTAARILDLELADVRQAGYDALRRRSDGSVERIQIKGRCCAAGAQTGQRVGQIKLNSEWDVVLLVMMNHDFVLQEIYEADRQPIVDSLMRPGSTARNKRGALSVQAFKRIAKRVYPKEDPMTPQNRETGSAGNNFGHSTAALIAKAIGAVMTRQGSNEALWNGRRVVIKCARANTRSVGVTYRMLDAIDSIVGAFERSDGGYDVRELLAEEFRNNMRDSRSTVGTGRVGIVAKKAFQDHGTSIRTVRI